MSDENIIQTIKTAIQDVVAPDVRELKVKLDELDKRLTGQISALDTRLTGQVGALDAKLTGQISALERRMQDQFEAANARSDAQFHALLAAINQSKAETELMVFKQISSISERVTALEIKLGAAKAA